MSAYHIKANQLRTTRITGVRVESPTVKTFFFRDKQCAKAKPGQFLMLWIPGVDEIPLSVAGTGDGDIVSVAVKKVGEATQALHEMNVGDVVGVRGPLGNSFALNAVKRKVLLVAGGTGIAPLLFLATKLKSSKTEIVFVLGAKTRNELLFRHQLEKESGQSKIRLVTVTEDGSCGVTGLCTKPAEQIVNEQKLDMVYACGPEQMLLKIFEIAEKRGIGLEISLERLMRCAIGLCGSCTIGRYRVCADGPVFTGKQLREVMGEFGLLKRDFDGKTITL